MMVLESGPDDTRFENFHFFRIGFPNFQLLYGPFFHAFHKNAVEIGFREV